MATFSQDYAENSAQNSDASPPRRPRASSSLKGKDGIDQYVSDASPPRRQNTNHRPTTHSKEPQGDDSDSSPRKLPGGSNRHDSTARLVDPRLMTHKWPTTKQSASGLDTHSFANSQGTSNHPLRGGSAGIESGRFRPKRSGTRFDRAYEPPRKVRRADDSDASPPRRPNFSSRDAGPTLLEDHMSTPDKLPPANQPDPELSAQPLDWRANQRRDGLRSANDLRTTVQPQPTVHDAVGTDQVASVRSGKRFGHVYEPPLKVLKGDRLDQLGETRSNTSRNRYNIKGGPRWDGVDRSNGFEQRLERIKAEQVDATRLAYKHSISDM